MKKIALLSSILLLTGSAFAQTPGAGIPGVFITAPTGNEQINIYGVGPQIQTIYLSQARDSSGYTLITQAATNTATVGNRISVLAFTGATAGTATITMAASPVDGQRIRIFSTAGITTLTLVANTGQTINNSATSIAANADVEYIYQLSSKTWFRIN